MCREHIEGDEGGTSVALARAAPPERGMAYRARAPRARSPRSSLGWGKPTTWRRGTGRRPGKGGRVRDAQEPEPQYMSSTGELIDIERVTISSEGDRWKSTRWGNSLAVYPTSRTVLTGGMREQVSALRLVPTHSERGDCAACTGAGDATARSAGRCAAWHQPATSRALPGAAPG